jgi:hypothetical protein
MKTAIPVIFLIVSFLNTGCSRFSRHPGFKKARHGIYYQLHTMGEDTVKARAGDYITVDLQYLTMHDSVFFGGLRKFQVNNPAFEGAIDECFMMLSAGESATFIIQSDNFFNRTLQVNIPRFLEPGGTMKVHEYD